MKNTIIILAFAFSICFGKGIEQRQSFSDTKQVAVEKKQGGTLLRFDHASLGDSAWQCTELFVPPNTKPEELQAFIVLYFPNLKTAEQTKLFTDFAKNAITKTSVDNLSQAYKKLAEHEARLKKLESKTAAVKE